MNAVRVEPLLTPGMRLSQPEFHARYKLMPTKTICELVGGVVHMDFPLGLPHMESGFFLPQVFGVYTRATPGVRGGDNGTVILDDANELQPDILLRVLPECGGSTRVEGIYICGVPELVVEVADSNEAVALGAKRNAYRDAGGREYLVLCLATREVHWFDLRRNSRLRRDREGIMRSRSMPGLWLTAEGLLGQDFDALEATIRRGLASPEHAAFVARLERRRLAHARRNPPPAS